MIRCHKEDQAASVKVKSTYASVLKSSRLLVIPRKEKSKPEKEKPLVIPYNNYLKSVREQLYGSEYFICIRFNDYLIKSNVDRVQKNLKVSSGNDQLELTSLDRLHMTICKLTLKTPEDLHQVSKALKEIADPFKGNLCQIPLFGLGDFRGQWLFAEVASREYSNKLYDLSNRCLEYSQRWCRKDFGEREKFVPHVTLAKVKKGISSSRVGIIDPSSYKTWQDYYFGIQKTVGLCLCSGFKIENGFYEVISYIKL